MNGERALPARRASLPIALLALLVPVFVALGMWQVQRLAWKEALIARVDAATQAAPLPVSRLPSGSLDALAYRRVTLQGRFDPAGTTLVTGTSALGSGYWVLVPLRTEQGRAYFVNRGFVPVGSKVADQRRRVGLNQGQVTVIGLLRLTEPHGTLLRANRPALDRWYARDIAAIAAKRGVQADPRLFIDAQGLAPPSSDPAEPVPGLTVIAFPNNHLGYALTWFTMALLCAGLAVVLWRRRS
ncbi:SURF1 family protein [Novosphingobium sp.]|uniref:SURF1 family protein n=1 Tax=Novosphingobium sp. TaxID=1874826 RepID=UPI0038BC9386